MTELSSLPSSGLYNSPQRGDGQLGELELRLILSTKTNGRNVGTEFTNSINLTRREAK